MIPLANLDSKAFYSMFVDKIAKKPTSQKYFSRLFGPEIQWENIYMLPYSVTVDTCTRYFQFKLSLNILFLNSFVSY